MKRILVLIISLFIMPVLVNAETATYNVCPEDCEYNNVSSIEQIINDNQDITDVIINYSDYDAIVPAYFFNLNRNINSLTINGNNSSLYIYIYEKQIKIININSVKDSYITILGLKENDDDFISKKQYLDNKINIYDSTIVAMFAYNEINIYNSIIKNYLYAVNTDVYIHNSEIQANIVAGRLTAVPGMLTNIFIEEDNKVEPMRRTLHERKFSYAENEISGWSEIEIDESDYGKSYGNNIYYKQSIIRTINKNTSISEFENEFIDTYIDSIGYDDIKNKPIEWKSENESIATLDNGTIKPIAKGQVDLVGTRGNDIYTIHLTVDMPAKKTNEKKVRMAPSTKITLNSVFKDLDISSLSDDVWEISNPKVAKVVNGEIISLAKGETDIIATINGVKYVYHLTVSDTLVSKEIKVPITGNSIKLWIIVVTILLLSVIGACSYILIKKK